MDYIRHAVRSRVKRLRRGIARDIEVSRFVDELDEMEKTLGKAGWTKELCGCWSDPQSGLHHPTPHAYMTHQTRVHPLFNKFTVKL